MLAVLERRGYVTREPDGGYRLTLRLFELAHQHPPLKRLLTVALPAMQELALATRQSNHLVDPLCTPHPGGRAGRQPRAHGLRRSSRRALSLSPRPRLVEGALGLPARTDAARTDRGAARQQHPRVHGGAACAASSPRSRKRHLHGAERHHRRRDRPVRAGVRPQRGRGGGADLALSATARCRRLRPGGAPSLLATVRRISAGLGAPPTRD